MTEPRRRWFVSIWDDDDPARQRLNQAVNLSHVEPPKPPEPETVDDDDSIPLAEPTPDKRRRIADLARRVRAGDLSARQALEELLNR
jgi:hypothetical protein